MYENSVDKNGRMETLVPLRLKFNKKNSSRSSANRGEETWSKLINEKIPFTFKSILFILFVELNVKCYLNSSTKISKTYLYLAWSPISLFIYSLFVLQQNKQQHRNIMSRFYSSCHTFLCVCRFYIFYHIIKRILIMESSKTELD